MHRLFPEHRIRPLLSLDGLWRFLPDESACPPEGDISRARQILTPSCWEMLPGFESWRGRAWIVRDLDPPGGGWSRVLFSGVSHTAEVFWNGTLVGRHEDAFTPFEVFLPPSGRGRLALRVDNTFGEHSGLHLSNDYYTYGGITRPVTIQSVPKTFLHRLRATPVRSKDGWQLVVKIHLKAPDGSAPRATSCRLWLGGRLLACEEIRNGVLNRTLDAGRVDEWSPDSPALYDLRAELLDPEGRPFDDLIDRIGFREVRVEGGRLLLNGRPLRLAGFNRHEDHAIFGCAIPPAAMAHDLALIRETGANFVRTAHYPNDRRFLDLCDETGMLVWEESHARQIRFEHPRALDQSLASTREMLDWHHNHPSIIIWGCLNECDTKSDEGVAFHEKILSLIKQTDPSRPVTYAGHLHRDDRAMHLADIVSHNIYPGWYHGGLDAIGPHLADLLAFIDSDEGDGGGKPVLISEFGGGAIEGFHAPPMIKGSEEYQAALLRAGIREILGNPRVSGLCIWQFADCRVCEEGSWWIQRPRCLNDKGVLTRDRKRKLAFDAVREGFRAALAPPLPVG